MDTPLSRTQKKKAAINLQKIGEKLVQLDETQINAISLPKELKTALIEAKHIKSHGAFRRQLQFIGRLMRDYQLDDVSEVMRQFEERANEQKRQFKMVENWRNELISGNEERQLWLMKTFPGLDKRQLEIFIRCAQGHDTQFNAKIASRKLFRLLIECVQKT